MSESFSITIRRLNDVTFKVEGALPGHTVEWLKQKIQELSKTDPYDQRLIFTGKQLEDGRTLSDYNIRHGSVITLVYRMRGD